MLRVTVDGRSGSVSDRSTILDAAAELGVAVPTLCHDPRLAPSGACRVCVVAVDGRDRPVAACTAPVTDGMVVTTTSREIEAVRGTIVRMLAAQYRVDATPAAPDNAFQQLLRAHHVDTTAAGAPDPSLIDDTHPTIRVDLSRCVSCWRCVRICDEVQGQFVWSMRGRGASTRVVPDSGTTLADSSCVACGACVDTCPSGALEDRSVVELGAPTRWTRTTCAYCGVGCELDVGTRGGRIVAAVPALDAPVNRGHLCVKGRAGHGFVHASDRITRPMLRRGDTWTPVGWDEAIATVADQFRDVLRRDGPTAIGVLGSARASNEDNYLVQKFARVVLGTNNVDCCARVCHAPSAVALSRMLGTGAATNSFADLDHAQAVLVCGANATENHPVIGARIKQATRRGARLVVVDPRRIELADYADVYLQIRPGTNILVLNAMAATIVDEGLVDEVFVTERVDGFDEFAAFVAAYRPERVSDACGVDAERIRAAARCYATARPAMSFHGLGLTEHHQGTENVMCLVNLALLTGNLGRPGAGVNPLRGQNNVQGAAHMGCEPTHLPGYAPLDQHAERVGEAWGARIPTSRGLDAVEMLHAAAAGRLRALWVIGWDILLTQPEMASTQRALANLDLLVVQDLFLNETARAHASVFLPAASAFEKDGTFMNAERRVQRVRRVLDPPDDAIADWEIVGRVADAMGLAQGFDFDRPDQIWEEIRRVWLPGAGISYSRLDGPGGLQWPCPDESHPGTSILHEEAFPGIGPRTTLARVEVRPAAEQPSDDFPFVLVTGRNLYAFNAGTMTARSSMHPLRATDTLEVATDDARRLGVRDGEPVLVRSRYGEAVLRAEVTARVASGVVFATFHDGATALNRVTGPEGDPTTHTPAYKRTAVRLEQL